ncbi:MAG: PCMD domain-containing protein [Bacteroidales bacterium]|nr:PCMD domain-containing protein [Bacteroidales bacterium]
MKRFLFLLFMFIVFCGIGQNIPNADFENWTGGNPNGWQTPNAFTQQYGVVTVTQETVNPHSGTYSVKLETKSIFGYAVTGLITNGQISVNLSNPNPITILGGTPFTERPNHFKGYFHYTPASGDYCTIVALLLKKNVQTNQFDTVGVAQYINNTSVTGWTMFDAPFAYAMGDTPDTMQIVAVSSNPNAAIVGSTLWVDHLYFEGGTLGNNILKLNEQIQVFPNPVNDLLNIYFGKPTTGQTSITIFNATGQRVKQSIIPAGTQISSLNIYDLPKGIYIIQIQNNSDRFVQKISVK